MKKQMRHTSCSQAKTHLLCPRKHYLEKIEGFVAPTGPAALLGKTVHKHIEDYLRFKRLIPSDTKAGRIALAVLPMVDPSSEPEVNFELPFISGLVIKGQIDLIRRADAIIEDIKTTSDIDRYGKTEDELRVDTQCIAYLWASRVHPDLPKSNTFSHLYVQTRGVHKTRRVTVHLTDEEIDQGIEAMKAHARLMLEHSKRERLQVPANTSACDAYGGCHLRSMCFMDGVFDNAKGESEMSNFLEMLAKKRKEAQAETPAKPETPKISEEPTFELPPEELVEKCVELTEQAALQAPEPEPMPTKAFPTAINPPDRMPDSEEPPAPTGKRGRPSKYPDLPAQFGGESISRMRKVDMVGKYNDLKNAVQANGDIKALYSHLDFDPAAKGVQAPELREKLAAFIKAIPADLEPAPSVSETEEMQNPHSDAESAQSLTGDEKVALLQKMYAEPSPNDEPSLEGYEKNGPTADVMDALKNRIGAAGVVLSDGEGNEVIITKNEQPTRLIPTPPELKPEPQRTLYVGCRPRGGNPAHLDEVLRKLRDQLTSARGRHWLCISDYGVTGSKLVAEALANIDMAELPATIYADPRIPGHDEAIAVLATTYSVIERG